MHLALRLPRPHEAPDTRVCVACGEEKATGEFFRKRGFLGYYRDTMCRACRAEYRSRREARIAYADWFDKEEAFDARNRVRDRSYKAYRRAIHGMGGEKAPQPGGKCNIGRWKIEAECAISEQLQAAGRNPTDREWDAMCPGEAHDRRR